MGVLFLLLLFFQVVAIACRNATFSTAGEASSFEQQADKVARFHQRRRTESPLSSYKRVAVECKTQPLFKCRSCENELQNEQDQVINAIQKRYPSSAVIQRTHKLLNTMFINVPVSGDEGEDDDLMIDQFVQSLPGVLNVYSSEDVELASLLLQNDKNVVENVVDEDSATEDYSQPLLSIGVDQAHTEYCALGKGVKVAVLDSGVDYTHKSMGGPGTIEAFQAAYGTNIRDITNKQRDGLFPTGTVTEGYDFVGDLLQDGESIYGADPDNDPIDLSGHGTGVAHAVRAAAPEAEIIAVKICTTTGNTCPDFAYVAALEYILDPNDDGDTSDHVDIVNLSLGRLYASSYYSVLSRATEEVAKFGVLPVAAAGNSGNRPYILGGASSTPNALTVGATAVYQDQDEVDDILPKITMASYSSRGPNESNHLKPDVVAPGGPFGLAKAATGTEFRRFQGTSFAAPLVAGGAALLKGKCPECSPFAIKALLMNHCHHDIQYRFDKQTTAPVTMQGSGQIQLERSLAAQFWAYSVEDVQPSIGLGIVNAAYDMVLKRTIRIIKLGDKIETVSLGYDFRSAGSANAVTVRFTPKTITLTGDCQSEFFVEVEFLIDASKAPPNRLYSGGGQGANPENLDWNEVDGWLLLTPLYTEQQVGLPFHMVLRRAADVTIGSPTYNDTSLDMTKLPLDFPVNLQNNGAETAQIDAYQLLFVSGDQPESDYGSSNPPSDIRYVGYRTIPVNVEGCTTLVEFAIHTWERQRTLSFTHFDILIDVDGDEVADYAVYNTGYLVGTPPTLNSEMRVINLSTAAESCVGFAPDHSTNTANSVLRLCTEDFDMEESGTIHVGVASYSFPRNERSDSVGWEEISIPDAALSVPSYDVRPGGTLARIRVLGTGTTPAGISPLGLLLYTNAYRSPVRTGSATFDSEAFVIYHQDSTLPPEYSLDVLDFPVAETLDGPGCAWSQIQAECSSRRRRRRRRREVLLDARQDVATAWSGESEKSIEESFANEINTRRRLQTDACVEYEVPRSDVTAVGGSGLESSVMTAAPITFIETVPSPTRPETRVDPKSKPPSTVPPLPIVEYTSGVFTTASPAILSLLLVGVLSMLLR